jgi:hypothetical protein
LSVSEDLVEGVNMVEEKELYKKQKKLLERLVDNKQHRILVSEKDNKILVGTIKPNISIDGKKYVILSSLRNDKYEVRLDKV